MSMRRIYTCNICNKEIHSDKLIGLYSTGNSDFKFGTPEDTDDVHICIRCLVQLENELNEFDLKTQKHTLKK